VKISIAKLIFAAAALAAALCLNIPASQASWGSAKWCAVTNEGDESPNWDCEFDTAEDCAPALAAGNRGFCALNPTYQPPAPQQPLPTNPQH
jgi:hypothetical protein